MKKWLISLFFALFLMSHNVAALELTSEVNIKFGSHQSYLDWSAPDSLCSRNGNYIVRNANSDVNCTINTITLSIPDRNDYVAGDIITNELYFYNSGRNDSGDFFARFNAQYTVSSNGAAVDLVDTRFEQLSSSSAKVTLYSRVWNPGNISALTFGFTPNVGFTLWPGEGISAGLATVWHEQNDVDYSTSINSINSLLSSINTSNSGIYERVQWINDDVWNIRTNVGTISGNVADIKSLLNNQGAKLDEISDNTKNVSDWADEQREAYENMQNTDGLVNIGDQSQALGIVGSINSFLGSITSTVSGDCLIDGDLGNVDLGELNLCNMPGELRSVVQTVAAVVFAVADVFLAWSTIKYVISLIDWARRN